MYAFVSVRLRHGREPELPQRAVGRGGGELRLVLDVASGSRRTP